MQRPREQQTYSIPLSKNIKLSFEKKNEPIISQKTLNQEEFKNPKTVSQKNPKKKSCCIKTKKKLIQTNPKRKQKTIKQN
jgi:sucrose-6-phosphate hydrolase SacC (GH32 family)